jgi:hypothetical protein
LALFNQLEASVGKAWAKSFFALESVKMCWIGLWKKSAGKSFANSRGVVFNIVVDNVTL